MSHFARVLNGRVQEVIVAEQDFIDNMVADAPGRWIQTSYNTKRGVHQNGGTPLRKNFAGIDFIYDQTRDAFYEPSPFPSWTFNEDGCYWEAPVAKPAGTGWRWNEETQTWDADATE